MKPTNTVMKKLAGTALAKSIAVDPVNAAGANPTKAEFDAVVLLVTELKVVINDLLDDLEAREIIKL